MPFTKRSFFARTASTILLWGLVVVGIVSQVELMWFLIVGLLSLLGVYEFLLMPDKRVPKAMRWASIFLAAGYLVWLYLKLWGGDLESVGLLDAGLVFALFMAMFLLQLRSPVESKQTLHDIACAIFAPLYAVLLFNFLIRILYLPPGQDEGISSGFKYALFLLAVTKGTDMGAFLSGSLLGKNKMIEHISPKKTWEGFLGSLVFAVLVAAVVYWPLQDELQLLNWPLALGCGLVLALVGTLGDLAESVIKRALEVKDSGESIPGIGGVLDLIDSICFTAPAFYFILLWLVSR